MLVERLSGSEFYSGEKQSSRLYRSLAIFHRQQFDLPVIGITGSNGKTIVKEWLNQLLEDRYRIVAVPRSYNSQIGVPLSVWQISETNDLALIEAGISQTGEMKILEEIIKPTIGVFTNIGEAHDQGFENTHAKILEKLELFIQATILIYPSDQNGIGKSHPGLAFPASLIRLISIGTMRRAMIQIEKYSKTNRQNCNNAYLQK